MARINITIPDGLLVEIDRTASSLGETRSGFLQEAGARYVDEVEKARERQVRKRDIDRGMAEARKIAAKIPAGYDGAGRIRQDRERDGS